MHLRSANLFNQFVRIIFVLITVALGAKAVLAEGHLTLKNIALRDQYIKTGPVGYFDLFNDGTSDVKIKSVTIPVADTGVFKLINANNASVVPPGKFTPIGVFMNLQDTLTYSTVVTVKSDASDSILIGTISVTGRNVTLHTTMQDISAHAFESFSIPIVVNSFRDQIGTAYLERYSCLLTYDPTLITFDSSGLTLEHARDTQGVSSGFVFKIDSPFTAGHVTIHCSGQTRGIHAYGDTIFKIAFRANQSLFTSQTVIRTVFTADSGFLYAGFSSDPATFTMLACSYPVKVTQSPNGRLLNNHPNPYNPSTRIRFEVDNTGYVQIRIYDRVGRVVKTLVDGVVEAGAHEIEYASPDVPSGTYFCRLFTGVSTDSRMITLSR